MRACWYKMSVHEPWKGGQFHIWGVKDKSDRHCDAYAITIGIVEDDDTSAIYTPHPENVHFGVDPSKR